MIESSISLCDYALELTTRNTYKYRSAISSWIYYFSLCKDLVISIVCFVARITFFRSNEKLHRTKVKILKSYLPVKVWRSLLEQVL